MHASPCAHVFLDQGVDAEEALPKDGREARRENLAGQGVRVGEALRGLLPGGLGQPGDQFRDILHNGKDATAFTTMAISAVIPAKCRVIVLRAGVILAPDPAPS